MDLFNNKTGSTTKAFSKLTIEEKRKILNQRPSILKQLWEQIKKGEETAIIDSTGGPSYNVILKKLSNEEFQLLIQGLEACADGDRYSSSKPLAAIEKYKVAVEILYWDEIAMMSLGCVYYNIGRNHEGLKWLEKAFKLNPNNERVKRNLEAVKSMM